jgi:hypothetical protein
MPRVIESLLTVTSVEEAQQIYWRIDSVVVRNGSLLPGAAEVCACLVQGLLSVTPAARAEILELLVQLGGGQGEDTIDGPELTRRVQHEVVFGFPSYAELLEIGNRVERFHCIDLLSICSSIDSRLHERCIRCSCGPLNMARCSCEQSWRMSIDETAVDRQIVGRPSRGSDPPECRYPWRCP